MRFIGDFHIHSHYSRATSKKLTPEYLDYWARIKGITVVGTGDITHPEWLKELREKLESAEEGLFKLKKEYKIDAPYCNLQEVRFILTGEISNIYKKGDKVRKVHNVIFMPDFDSVERLQNRLQQMGFNITSDGRPIMGLDSRDLLEICLDISHKMFFVPAHIWTPWFSAMGSKSGFDSIQECYGDLASHIYAVETGLSTDPPLNWMLSSLDKYTLVSNSDAHSPEKLGRNANIFDTELSYHHIIEAMKTGDDSFVGTIDMYPQEGKYHYDGHRKCDVCWNPVETLRNNGICPVCGKKVVIGVTNRIVELSDRVNILERPNRKPFYSLIPLKELISEIEGVGVASKRVCNKYDTIIQKAGSEFNVLLHFSIEKIKEIAGEMLAEAIVRMRDGNIYITEGYDGEYGKIRVFTDDELQEQGLSNIFREKKEIYQKAKTRDLLAFDLAEYKELSYDHKIIQEESVKKKKISSEFNAEQNKAATHFGKPAMVIAGPGTGKTKVLTGRIAYLLKEKNVEPNSILAVTFTNKAAQELQQRIAKIVDKKSAEKINVSTFHALGLQILKQIHDNENKKIVIIDDDEKQAILKSIGVPANKLSSMLSQISNVKSNMIPVHDISDEVFVEYYLKYDQKLEQYHAYDFDDLIYKTVLFLLSPSEKVKIIKEQFSYMLIDEYQDINTAQYELVRALMPNEKSDLFVIGDPNQSIYGFRGANITLIDDFIKDYNPDIYKLKKSYRCSNNILSASEDVIKKDDAVADVLKGLKKGVKIKLSSQKSEKSEAEFIARSVESAIGGVDFFSMDSNISRGEEEKNIGSLADFAVLCRSRIQMPAIVEAFKNHNIPFQIIGEEKLTNSKSIKKIISILKYIVSPDNELIKSKLDVDGVALPVAKDFVDYNTEDIIKLLTQKYFIDISKEEQKEIEFLSEMSKGFEKDTEGFINSIVLNTQIEKYRADIEAVTIMTMHASKGLEFETVFVAGCEQGLMPYTLFHRQSDEDEEQRLLYVAMTRAKKNLYLTNAKTRLLHGKIYENKRSSFIDKIEQSLLQQVKTVYQKKNSEATTQLDLF